MVGKPEVPEIPEMDFLTLWKDADPDVPILKEAKAEYAKLQSPSRLGESLPF
jgi:hypothetical protein